MPELRRSPSLHDLDKVQKELRRLRSKRGRSHFLAERTGLAPERAEWIYKLCKRWPLASLESRIPELVQKSGESVATLRSMVQAIYADHQRLAEMGIEFVRLGKEFVRHCKEDARRREQVFGDILTFFEDMDRATIRETQELMRRTTAGPCKRESG